MIRLYTNYWTASSIAVNCEKRLRRVDQPLSIKPVFLRGQIYDNIAKHNTNSCVSVFQTIGNCDTKISDGNCIAQCYMMPLPTRRDDGSVTEYRNCICVSTRQYNSWECFIRKYTYEYEFLKCSKADEWPIINLFHRLQFSVEQCLQIEQTKSKHYIL